MFLRKIKEFHSLLEEMILPEENCRHALYVKDSSIHIQMAFPSELVQLVLSQDEEECSPNFLLEKIKEFLEEKVESLNNLPPTQEEKDSRQLSFDF